MNKAKYLMVIMATLAISTHAGSNGMNGSTSPEKAGMGSGMSMMDMTTKVQGECMMASDTLGGLLKTVQDARKSDDKAKMTAALQRVEEHIAAMKAHMGQCTDMMGMMGHMMGGNMMKGGMMGKGMMNGNMMKSDSTMAEPMSKKGNQADHEAHHPK